MVLMLLGPTLVRAQDDAQINVLVFSKTKGYRHQSISNGVKCMWELGLKNHWNVVATEDASMFNDDFLKQFDAVVWLCTTGDVLNDEQQQAFERFIRSGKGYVGIHAAADTEYDWPWYGEMLAGAWFKTHPPTQMGTLIIEDTNHPATAMMKDMDMKTWTVIDEWYTYRQNPRSKVHVLMSLDENTVKNKGDHPEEVKMGDHPFTWYRMYDGGRIFYTGRGHTSEAYDEPLFRAELEGAIEWAAGKAKVENAN